MPIAIKQIPFTDFEALQDVVPDNKSNVMQLGTGRMTGSITHASLDPGFDISAGNFTVSAQATGVMSDSRWGLGHLLRTDGPALGHHHEFGAGDLAIAAPGEDRYARFRDNTEYIVAFLSPQELQAFLAPSPGAFDWLLKHPLSIRHAAPAAAIANVATMRPLLDTLVHHGATLPDDAATFLKRDMLELLTMPIRDAVHYCGSHLVSADDLVRDIDHYYDYAGIRPVHVSELCEHFGVHPRKLHRACHDVTGMGPVTLGRIKRLNHVHTALRKGGRNRSVRDIAVAHGFFDLGRFAEAYKRMFGELPSQTLRRSIRAIATVAFAAYSFVGISFIMEYDDDDFFIRPAELTDDRHGDLRPVRHIWPFSQLTFPVPQSS